MANNVKLKDSSPISNNLTDIAVGGEDSCLAISKDSGIRVKGGVDASGDLKIGDETFINLKKDGPIDVRVKNWQGEGSRVRPSSLVQGPNENNINLYPGGAVNIKNKYGVDDGFDNVGLSVDVDDNRSGTTTSKSVGLDISVDKTAMSGGTNNAYGIDINCATGNTADSGTQTSVGIQSSASGNTNGSSQAIGASIITHTSDNQTGVSVRVDNGAGPDIKMLSSAVSNDYGSITTGAGGATTISTVHSTGSNGHLSLKPDGNLDLTCVPGGGVTAHENDGTEYTPATDASIITKKYSDDTYRNYYQWIPITFNERAARTYFRNADDFYNPNEWDSYDSETETTLGNTITIASSNYMSGFIVPVASRLLGARWTVVQSYAESGNAHFQLYTATTGTATLRTTNDITSNRARVSEDTADITQIVVAGTQILPAIVWVSGANSTWYGGVTLKLRDTS